jgi:hypothetical protein
MLATVLLAASAALPLGVWPQDTGHAARVVDDIEIYVVEPEDDYSILAVQPIVPALSRSDSTAITRLVAIADRLGADAIVLLGEMPEATIPKDVDDPLPTTGRYAGVAYVVFSSDDDQSPSRTVPTRGRVKRSIHHRGRWFHLRAPVALSATQAAR